MSLAGGGHVQWVYVQKSWYVRGGVNMPKGVDMARVGYPYHVTYPMMHVMLPTPTPPVDRHT